MPCRRLEEPAQFASQLVIGITNGAIIALVAFGYTLVYGIIELINFAHGDNFMIGSFVGLTVLSGTVLGISFFAPITDDSGTLIRLAGVELAIDELLDWAARDERAGAVDQGVPDDDGDEGRTERPPGRRCPLLAAQLPAGVLRVGGTPGRRGARHRRCCRGTGGG